MTDKTFPDVQGGGSLLLAWQVRNKHVLVVGGGEVAAGRILNVLNADARVTVICPSSGLNAEVAYRIEAKQVTHIDRVFQPSDLESLPPDGTAPDMVMTAVDDPLASSRIWTLCKELRIPANIADVPPECDFYFGSVHRDGPLQIMVSTNGKGPRLAAGVRKFIAEKLPANVGDAIEQIGTLRQKLRRIAPEPQDGPKRMRWMIKVTDQFSWGDICELSEEDMDNILTMYESGQVPTKGILLGMRGGRSAEEVDVFDGSYGFFLGA